MLQVNKGSLIIRWLLNNSLGMYKKVGRVSGMTTILLHHYGRGIRKKPGADPELRGGAYFKKLRRAEGGAKIFGVFRAKNHDFTPKNRIFSNFRGACAGCAPPTPLDPPLHRILFLCCWVQPIWNVLPRVVQDTSIKYRNHLGNDLIFMVSLCQVFIIRSVFSLSCILDSPYLVHTLMTEGTCSYFFICNLNLIAVSWYFDLISFLTKFQTQKITQ